VQTADQYSERTFGAPALAPFEPLSPAHRAAAAALLQRLTAIGFDAERAAGLFGVAEIADVRASRTGYYETFTLPADAAGRAARFFVLHDAATEGDLQALLGGDLVRFLADMALIVRTEDGWRSLASATWFGGRLIFTDARAYNLIWPGDPPPDYVMPPGGDSVGLLRVAPRTRRRATLDLCCGAGAQTLAAAEYSDHVMGIDLNPRALRFAAFNAAVNRIDDAVFLLGDCYEPLEHERFDAILANPPFVPWPDEDPLLYRGGGSLGDEVLARILFGALERLEPCGSLAIVADLANSAQLAKRIHDWQGISRRTLILLQQRYGLLAYAETHAAHVDDASAREALTIRLLRHYVKSGIETLDFGYILQDGELGATHVQRTQAPQNLAIDADVASWFTHQQRLARGDAATAPLILAPGLRVGRETARTAEGGRTGSCYALPGAASVQEAAALTERAFALLDRIADGGVRATDITEPEERRELGALLDQGLVRLGA
jgi:carbamoyltransferase